MQAQKILILYLHSSALDSRVTAWSSYDGTTKVPPVSGDEDEPPYATGIDAMRDGWRVIQMSGLAPQTGELEYEPGLLAFEVIFEKIEEVVE